MITIVIFMIESSRNLNRYHFAQRFDRLNVKGEPSRSSESNSS
jgi:hypothetical protein